MRTIEPSEEERYQEWVAENGEFLNRYVKEIAERGDFITEYTKEYVRRFVEHFFDDMSHSEWQRINRNHLYAELRELMEPMVEYYASKKTDRGYRGLY